MKDTMTVWQRADIAAQLSAIAYMDPKPAAEACKNLGFTNANLISVDGAEVLVAKDPHNLWFAFRGTEPAKLNDVFINIACPVFFSNS